MSALPVPAAAAGEGAASAPKQEQPAWAKRMHRRQQITHAATTAAHTLRGGDGGGSGKARACAIPIPDHQGEPMRFKRPQVRYADTPQPATPYQSAAQVWDERIGSARVQAKNWR
jgi:hypothetical protein